MRSALRHCEEAFRPTKQSIKPAISIEKITNTVPLLSLFESIEGRPYSFLLDSAVNNAKISRYSMMSCDPFLVFKSKRDSVTLEWNDGRREHIKGNPFLILKKIFKKFTVSSPGLRTPGCAGRGWEVGLPFIGGGVGYFAYDMKDFVEDLPDTAIDDMNIPDCIMGFYNTVLIHDKLGGDTYLSTVKFPGIKNNVVPYSEAVTRKNVSFSRQAELKSNFSKINYINTINRAKEYIKTGDIYQVNLSQRFETLLNMEPLELYLRLRDSSPAPFASYLNFGDVKIISSSPERFLMKKGDYIETRPIKGTRPRSEDPAMDAVNEKELRSSPKDLAEHVMIVDLERNDLGRICEYGSVKPSEFISLEKYSTVFHLVSTVSGKLRKDVDAIDCLLAAFPGGSITGAPKIRSMQIIEELEPVKRSVYTGAIGYISFDGNMDTSIAIRTAIAKGNKIYFQAGGGIVADSDPEAEYEETLHKARGFMQAIGVVTPPRCYGRHLQLHRGGVVD